MTKKPSGSSMLRRSSLGRSLALIAVPVLAAAVAGTPAAQADTKQCAAVFGDAAQWHSGFSTTLAVTNTGTVPLTGWRVTWTFGSGEKIFAITSTRWSQTGPDITASNAVWNGNLAPGGQVLSAVNGSSPGGAFTPSGLTCTTL